MIAKPRSHYKGTFHFSQQNSHKYSFQVQLKAWKLKLLKKRKTSSVVPVVRAAEKWARVPQQEGGSQLWAGTTTPHSLADRRRRHTIAAAPTRCETFPNFDCGTESARCAERIECNLCSVSKVDFSLKLFLINQPTCVLYYGCILNFNWWVSYC